MIKMLLTVFAVGLVVSCVCWAGVVALGGPRHWNISKGDGTWSSSWEKDGKDNGPTVTREMAWTGGDSLQFDVPAMVHYVQGPVAKITVEGPKAWVDKLDMDGDRLTMHGDVRLKGKDNHGLKVEITAPGVTRFQMNSALKFDLENYAQDDLDIQTNGAAQINAKGSAKRLKLQVNGAGQANLGRLVNEEADVELNGAGQATLAATERVRIEINGVGQAKLIHQPRSLTQEIHGFGNVKVDSDAMNDNDAAWEEDDDKDAAKNKAKPATPATPATPAKPAAKAKAAA